MLSVATEVDPDVMIPRAVFDLDDPPSTDLSIPLWEPEAASDKESIEHATIDGVDAAGLSPELVSLESYLSPEPDDTNTSFDPLEFFGPTMNIF
jgi:hypothetical protein